MRKSKVVVDEDFLNNLLSKALPKEYEVLLEGYGIDEDEEEYFYLIIALLQDHVEVILDWLGSDDAKQILNGTNELGLNFFDELEYKIRLMIHERFNESIIPLLLSWYTFGNETAYAKLNLTPVFSSTDWLVFDFIKQYNYNTLTDLSRDVCVTLRDALYDGINKGLSIDELTDLLMSNGLRGRGKFSARTRAEMTAITERTRVLNQARINAFKENNVEWVNFTTKNDNMVCPDCRFIETMNPIRLDVLEANDWVPPLHPRCRCELNPAVPPQAVSGVDYPT